MCNFFQNSESSKYRWKRFGYPYPVPVWKQFFDTLIRYPVGYPTGKPDSDVGWLALLVSVADWNGILFTNMFQNSVKFDPFLFLPVPLPKAKRHLTVFFHRKDMSTMPIKVLFVLLKLSCGFSRFLVCFLLLTAKRYDWILVVSYLATSVTATRPQW